MSYSPPQAYRYLRKQQARRAASAPAVAAPVNVRPPAILGAPTVGQTLTSSAGGWSGNPYYFAYQWRRAGSAIGGATAKSYVAVLADVGTALSCSVTASNETGSTAATSAPTGAVA